MKNLFTYAFTASFMLGSGVVSAQTQYTPIRTVQLVNADFTADQPLAGISNLYTYSKDMADAGLGAGGADRFGLQAITGWTANIPSDNIKNTERTDGADAKAAGIFTYNSESADPTGITLGGAYYAPNAPEGSTQGLGLVAVWGAEATYTQDVTLPAGAYMLIAKLQNTSGANAITNRFGFIVSDTESYMSTKTTYAAGTDEWELDTIIFKIDSEKSGKVSIGYKSNGNGSAVNPHIYYDYISLSEIDPAPLIKAEVDELKKKLARVIKEAEFSTVDASAAKAVYDDESATLEGVQEAIDALKQKIRNERMDLSAFFLTNAHFDDDDAIPEDNGICTYAKDKATNNVDYSGMQEISSWTASNPGVDGPAAGVFSVGSNSFLGGKAYLGPKTLSNGATEGKLLGLVTCWTGIASYTQGVSLPKGKYALTFSYYNANQAQDIAKNLMGFITDEGVEYLGETLSFPNGEWTEETVLFELTEETAGTFSMGYKATNTGSGNMPHLFVDGVSLAYTGEMNIDPSLFALQASVKSAKNTDGYYSEELTQKLSDLIEQGDELIESASGDADKNTEVAKAINEIIPVIKANIKAYEKLATFNDETLPEAMDKYESVESLYGTLETLKDEVDEAYNDRTWATDKINETISSLDGIIKSGIQSAFDAAVESGNAPEGGLDISLLYDQLSYTYSESAVSNTDVPDKEWSYGDANTFKTQYGTAEVWNKSPFTVSRTLKDMPAGTYTITTKAFFRNADNTTNIENAAAEGYKPEAAVFAGYNKTALTNVAEIASDSEVENWAAAGSVYVPNSQKAAYDIFNNEEYTDKVQKSVQTVLTEKGDLTFGVKADQMNNDSWVVWYSFDIKYNGAADEEVIKEALETAIEDAKTYKSNNVDGMNEWANAQADVAIEKAENAIGSDAEATTAAIKDVESAVADMKAAVEALTAYNNAMDALTAAVEAEDAIHTDKSDNAYTEVMEKANGYNELTTEDLIALTKEMKYVEGLFRIPEVPANVSDDNPFDMTSVIVNPDFENEEDGLKGWSYYKGSDTQAADNTNDTYATEGSTGAKIFNTWNGSAPEGGFYVSQEMPSLPAGTYQLTVLVASDKGNTINVTAGEAGYSLVVENDKNVGADVNVVFTVKDKESVTLKVQSASWFKADNFRLSYFGTNSQKETTGVDGIEESADSEIAAIYNAAGAKVNALVKGVNIITYKNGTTKKVILK